MSTRWLAAALVATMGCFAAGCGSGNTGGSDGSGGGGDGSSTMDAAGDAARGDGAAGASDGASGNGDGASGNGDGSSGNRDGSSTSDGASGNRDGASGGMEICDNGLDDNGDGRIDEACSCAPGSSQRCFAGDRALAGVGQCGYGTQACTGSGEIGTWGTCTGSGAPTAEVCDGVDNNCDGRVDETCQCQPGAQQTCYTGPAGTNGTGRCHGGAQLCSDSGSGSSWGPCNGDVTPTTEVCGNAVDDDCDGMVDEDCACDPGSSRACYDGDPATRDVGVCRSGTQACVSDASGTHWASVCSGQVLPLPTEVCGDGLDNNCNGQVDEGCECPAAATRSCYAGPPGTAGVGVCRAGTQSCVSDASGTHWSPCSGEVDPSGTDTCGDGVDNNCNGTPDEGCACPPGATQGCYDGPGGTQNVGVCRGGTQSCAMGASGSTWTTCSGEVLPSGEVCGDGVDNDCNGYVDETCPPCITASGTAWQINLGQGPQCTGYTFASHGDPGEYAWSSIPPEGDSGWGPEYDQSISFSDPSTLCGTGCDCLNGVDFTYFQTFFDLPAGFNVSDLRVTINNVDDGVQITVFNSAYPGGVVDPGGYAYLGGGSTTNLAPYIRAGRNRIVLTHVDDCCQVRQIAGVTITLNGGALTQCP